MHQVRDLHGTVEPLHGHDWYVWAHFSAEELDKVGMVLDFGLTRQVLEEIVGQLHYANLNTCIAFAGQNPTAENVARWIYDSLCDRDLGCVRRVLVQESPGCSAEYERV